MTLQQQKKAGSCNNIFFFGEWAANHEKGCYFFFCKATLLIISSPRTSDDTPSFYVAVSLVYVQTKHGLLSTFGALPRCAAGTALRWCPVVHNKPCNDKSVYGGGV